MTKPATASAAAVLTAALFAPAVGFGFVNLDDTGNFVANDRWRGFSAENFRWMATAFHKGHYKWFQNPLRRSIRSEIVTGAAVATGF